MKNKYVPFAVAESIYEIDNHKMTKYLGNYTNYKEKKK